MTYEDKNLLLKDLCARLPYDLTVELREGKHTLICIDSYGCFQVDDYSTWFGMDSTPIKPYLRPMSSMTEKELNEWATILNFVQEKRLDKSIDWLNVHHFDYRGLIEKGLALEAPEDMYKEEIK